MALVFCDSFSHYSTLARDEVYHIYSKIKDQRVIGPNYNYYGTGYRSGSGLDMKWDGNDEGVTNWHIKSPREINEPKFIYSYENAFIRRFAGALTCRGYSGVLRKQFKETSNGFVFGAWVYCNSSWSDSNIEKARYDTSQRSFNFTVWDLYEVESWVNSPGIFLLDRNQNFIAEFGFEVVSHPTEMQYTSDGKLVRDEDTGEIKKKLYTRVNFGCGSTGAKSDSSLSFYGNYMHVEQSHWLDDITFDRWHLRYHDHIEGYDAQGNPLTSHKASSAPADPTDQLCHLEDAGSWWTPARKWHHVEFKVVYGETTGSYKVRIDGVQIYQAVGINNLQSGKHALNSSGEPTISSIGISKRNWDHPIIQDLYLLDTNSPEPNDFLGPTTNVDAIPIATKDYNYHEWTYEPPDTTATYNDWSGFNRSFYLENDVVDYVLACNYPWRYKYKVGEDAFGNPQYAYCTSYDFTFYNGEIVCWILDMTKYKYTKTQGDCTTFTFYQDDDTFVWDIDDRKFDSIKAIQKCSLVRKTDAGTMILNHRLRINGTNYDSSDFRLTDKLTYKLNPYGVNPDTGLAWTRSEFKNLEFGLVVSTW